MVETVVSSFVTPEPPVPMGGIRNPIELPEALNVAAPTSDLETPRTVNPSSNKDGIELFIGFPFERFIAFATEENRVFTFQLLRSAWIFQEE